ncbi:mercuric transporter MerT family protein [endosymbiont of Ridgeia piscesae]|jgi:mercuric ion transport protein|uniref:mercuric transporter MerT family protein n=1 Tax=endosymbiont of Ridgeia piscesae TaxID=54398 RepID=UPI000716DCB3|nr:mercuric transporter MerT family protein [endosymbiont of Ridgeia piscesae]
MSEEKNRVEQGANRNRTLIAAAMAAVGASICSVGPFVLLMLGISGAWISNLTAFEPYRPIFIGITLLFLGLAFRKLYLLPETCEVGKPCAKPATRRNQRIIFWVVTASLAALITFPWYGPMLLS